MASETRVFTPPEVLRRPRNPDEVVYSVEHFYVQHPEHPLTTLMALRHRFLQEAGINTAHLTISETDGNAVQQVASGLVDIAIDAHPIVTLKARAAGQDVYMIGAYRNGMPFGVWARRGIRTMADLKGKRLGIIKPTDILHRAFGFALPQFGIDPERDVEFVRAGETLQRIEALRTGLIDAALFHYELEEPFAERIPPEEGLRRIDDMGRLLPQYVSRATITSGRMLRERPEAVRAFLRGIMRAQQYLHDADPHGKEAVEMVKAVWGVNELEGSRMKDGWTLPWSLQAKDINVNVEGILVQARHYQQTGQLPADFDPLSAVRADIAREVFQGLGLAATG